MYAFCCQFHWFAFVMRRSRCSHFSFHVDESVDSAFNVPSGVCVSWNEFQKMHKVTFFSFSVVILLFWFFFRVLKAQKLRYSDLHWFSFWISTHSSKDFVAMLHFPEPRHPSIRKQKQRRAFWFFFRNSTCSSNPSGYRFQCNWHTQQTDRRKICAGCPR